MAVNQVENVDLHTMSVRRTRDTLNVRNDATVDGRHFDRVRGFSASTAGKYALTAAMILALPENECSADLDKDGQVNTQDLTMFLGRFGVPCP